MADVKRQYDATGRRAAAEANRRSMLDAALELLLRDGYAATSLTAVAERAGLSTPTAYKVFGNKPSMVKAVFDYVVAGDDDPRPIPQRERAARILAEPDPVRKLDMYTEGLMGTLTRAAPLQLVVRSVAEVDGAMRDVWEQMCTERLTGMSIIANHLADGGHLSPDVPVDKARDILWTYTSPELYELLVSARGWPAERYRKWVKDALVASLLTPHD